VDAGGIIEVRDLRRTFGAIEAVRGVSFAVPRGQVVGFIGANGAGKTTTMRMMVTLDVPDAGVIRICGVDVVERPHEARRRIGWMPDSFGTYPHMAVWEYLDFFARALGYRGRERRERLAQVMEFTDLGPLAEQDMPTLSKGQAQRLCLGRTLLADPEVLILDEPAAGLDPKARLEFKDLLRLLADDGKTIFISSHILSELAEVCDALLFIDEGRIVHYGSPASLAAPDGARPLYALELAGAPERLAEWVATQPRVALVELHRRGGTIRFEADDAELIAATLRRMVVDGLPVVDFHRQEASLEDAFVRMLGKVKAA